jgi:hypothetical protein
MAELADWDEEMLKIELSELEEMNFDMGLTGFDKIDIDALFEDENLGINMESESESDSEDQIDEKYTNKVSHPIYEIKGDMPEINELYDLSKTNSLVYEINKSNFPQEIKNFLEEAAKRHTIFNYEKIAEFYAHQNQEIQQLMENSALVIIDFNKAIKNGFVKLSDKMEQILASNKDE